MTRGYKDIPVSVSAGETVYYGFARVTDVNGVVSSTKSLTLYVDTVAVAPPQPGISTVTDNNGAVTGDVARGGTTDDTTPTVQISLGPNAPLRFQDSVQLIIDGSPAGASATVTSANLQQGYILITAPALSNGTHAISARVTDGAGNVSALAASYSITVQPDGSSPSGQTYTANNTRDQVLTGTAGDDTFYSGHNSVILTGNSGADKFIYQHVPWNNTGHVTTSRRKSTCSICARCSRRAATRGPTRLPMAICASHRTARAERRCCSIPTAPARPIPGPS